jgi:hypothetical protein
MRGAALLLAALLTGEAEGAYLQVSAAVHVHTDFSTGALRLEEVVKEARLHGIGAVILSDNFLLRFEYGLFPLEGLVRKVVEKPSVLRAGVGRYLSAIEEAQARFPDVILIHGVEVVPYYYWSGSLVGGDLTLWNAQKNLLVVGLERPEDYEGIPVIGNGRTLLPRGRGLVKLGLAASAIAGGILLTRVAPSGRTGLRLVRWGAYAVGGLLVLDVLAAPAVTPYAGDLGVGPHQAVIDWVEARGGRALWSLPQARDFSRTPIGPLGAITVRTEPYPEALLQTRGYTGFGAVYPERVTFTDPGGHWDQLLLEYARGRRARPAWGIGEVAYHGPPKPLGDALTVFLVSERSRAAILEALRAGRLYALRAPRDSHLVLEEFRLGQEGARGQATLGDELESDGHTPLVLTLRVTASDGRAELFTARLIRSGKVLDVFQGRTPFERTLRLGPPGPGTREYVRLDITPPHRLLSSPIFVRGRG